MPTAEERKVVSVLFADLVGSTELSVRHDPEQLRGLLSAFFDEMAQQIRAFGGMVEKYAGDAIMAVFGVPQVHEDDAERAVRAAVAMRESLVQLNPMFEQEYGARLELRVGIATGEAVAVTEPTRELMVTGEVTNLAARLQTAGGGIVLCPETFRLVRPLVEANSTGPLELKGFLAPVTAHIVSGLRPSSTTRGVPGLSSPLVGREHEMAKLRLCGEELVRGRGSDRVHHWRGGHRKIAPEERAARLSAGELALDRGTLSGLHPEHGLCPCRSDLAGDLSTHRSGGAPGGTNKAPRRAALARR
jgi:class 3 adenylate cyclase